MLKAYPVPGKAKSAMLCQAFINGAPKDAKGSVFSGVKAGNFKDWKRVRASGEDWFYVDNAYFDQTRATHFRATKNALQHTQGGMSDGKRFDALGATLGPWRDWNQPGHVVVVDQSEDHMEYTLAVDCFDAEVEFLMNAVEAKRFGPIRRRPWSANKLKLQATLAQDLVGANLLVTHTSAAAVMAVLAGVPVVCSPLCAVGMIEHGHERLARLRLIADHQFTIDEMKEGLAWRTLNP